MQNNYEICIAKGQYKHYQNEGFWMAKDYVFLKKDERKCLLQRFVNQTPYTVNGVKFDLIEKDTNGKVIKKTEIAYDGLWVASGSIFVEAAGVVVSDECVDFEIRNCVVVVGRYRYRVKHGKIQAYYDRRQNKATEPPKASGQLLTVKPYVPSFSKLHRWLAVLALVMSAIRCSYYLFYPYLK